MPFAGCAVVLRTLQESQSWNLPCFAFGRIFDQVNVRNETLDVDG